MGQGARLAAEQQLGLFQMIHVEVGVAEGVYEIAGFEACHTAMLTLGGMGYAQEYHVERYLREILIPRTAPVSPHMILNFLAEKVFGLPKSY